MTKKPFVLTLLNQQGEKHAFTADANGIVFVPSGSWIMLANTVIPDGVFIHGSPTTVINWSQRISIAHPMPSPFQQVQPRSAWREALFGGLAGIASETRSQKTPTSRRKPYDRTKRGVTQAKPKTTRKAAVKGRKSRG